MTRGRKEPPLHRLLDKTAFDTDTGCWQWTASRTPGGYGSVRMPGIANNAHRALYSLMVGPLPPNLHLDHLCRNRLCVNPDHLEPVSQAENNRRAGAARTHCKYGHEYTPDNTYRRKGRGRECRECLRTRSRERYRATRATTEVRSP
ncbi:HNH endonuclease signature motif containing protein [Streptomyces albidoflavus]|uniref:HNH endonuclease signature motif containing protein n=1 Tax=Streptomyces albidoflavus TaxID=1886 RepID=UPI0033F5421E